ncbi:META domain-containing protein [Zhihengliuella salsuginis]|nr:META domain-containing protein [Zhihengliuella salsuginis]
MAPNLPRALPLVLAVLAAAGLSACDPAGGGSPVQERVLGRWGMDDGASAWLRFDADGSLTGSDGCNRLSGSWSVDDGRVRTLGVVRTLMWCENLVEWIGDLDTLEVEGDVLVVFDADGGRVGTLTRP